MSELPTADPSRAHLLGRLAVVEARVRAAVTRRRATDPDPDDAFRGMYLSDSQADQLLASQHRHPRPAEPVASTEFAEIELAADAAEAQGVVLRLRRLARSFGLVTLDVELLLVALAPDLDDRMERLYGYLHDDLTRRRASAGLALELCGVAAFDPEGRRRLGTGGPLADHGLLLIEEPARPFLSRPLRVPDRVARHLVGDDHPDPLLLPLLHRPPPAPIAGAEGLGRVISRGGLCYLRERVLGTGASMAAAAFTTLGVPMIAADLRAIASTDDLLEVVRAAAREARLLDAGLVAGPVEALVERAPHALRALGEVPWPVVLTGGAAWDPGWTRRVALVIDVDPPGPSVGADLWRANLGGDDHGLQLEEATSSFRLSPEQVRRAAIAAQLEAALADRPLREDDLRAGARRQNAGGLERLARRIEPEATLDDLVLPPEPLAMLRELVARARHRQRVYDDWGLRRGGGRGEGIAALFGGESGTGKTMAAEAVAGVLGLDLYTVNLATVVDKYIGETEKNLERIFTEAEGVNGVLFFDEADALFGKRSDVSDAKDRYANVEVAYLLQRMEQFDGIAILATNLRGNVDDAFTRRLAVMVDFPVPDEVQRRRLWERSLGPKISRSPDLDLDFLAHSFQLCGGSIRNVVVTAAFLAADAGTPVGMSELTRAVEREYRKMGRLCTASEFGPYLSFVRPEAPA